MVDTPTIIKAITDMHNSFDQNLDKVYTEIKGCNKRVTELETVLAIKKASCKEKKEREAKEQEKEQEKAKEKRTFWRSILRVVSIAGILTLFTSVWKGLAVLWGLAWKGLVSSWELLP